MVKKLLNSLLLSSETAQSSSKVKTTQKSSNLVSASQMNIHDLFNKYETGTEGLDATEVETSREKYGNNIIEKTKKISIIKQIIEAFINPFTIVLIVLAVVSLFADVIYAAPEEKDSTTVIIIMSMVIISGVIKFVQERRSDNAAESLLSLIKTTTNAIRKHIEYTEEIPLEDVVVGDIIHISAGDMVPADMRIISAKDLFISQSSLTGESEPVEKFAETTQNDKDSVTEYNNIVLMGSTVISGTARGVVIAVGNNTLFGKIAKTLNQKPAKTTFEEGINSVSFVLIRFMLIMVPVVFFINGITKGDWMSAFLFAISVAVGLTPEMLPMIVTTSLAKGAVSMSKEKTIIKNLKSIQNLGSIDILCTDKTGTLTQDKVVLEYHLDINGEEDTRVLKHAFLNSYFQTGLKNLMDKAIIEAKDNELEDNEVENKEILKNLTLRYKKVDEIPFDFERRRMSVVVEDKNRKRQMITKGAIEEMLAISSYAEFDGVPIPLTDEIKDYILSKVDDLNDDGMRVLGIAQKTNPAPVGQFSVKDESDMVLLGYLAFLDPPKESTAAAVKALHEHGVEVKILTGDNEKVTRNICRQVGISTDHILLGSEIENMTDEELSKVVERTTIFAKLSPTEKSRVITTLKNKGHSVGYMGDGINDASGMRASDVGISVDTAVDIAKESADVILLEKDLMVLEQGIIEGRKTYANMIKYIKMTASSNFGNMFSVLIASAFLPFLPMQSLHLILLNLIYDLSCTSIPWDNVDKEYLKTPRTWNANSINKFMIWFGPTSSVFDIITYLVMYFVICPMFFGGMLFTELSDITMQLQYIALFQSGWFVASMWTQSLVIHMIRTPKIPFIESRASLSVTLLTFAGIALLTIIPFTAFGAKIDLAPLPLLYFGFLAFIVIGYMLLVTVIKKIFIKRYGELL